MKSPENAINQERDGKKTKQPNNTAIQKLLETTRDMCNSALGSEVKGSKFIGEYLFELWKNQCLCDVQLQVGSISYMAHKIVLAAFSEVFCPSDTNIPPTVCVDIPGTTPEALFQVLQYLYTSEMELTDDSLEPIISAACFMGITDIVEMVKEILANPTVENLPLYMGIRQRLGMSARILDFLNLVRENFIELMETEVFLCIPPEDLECLLQDPGVMVDSELDTLSALIKWLEFSPCERVCHAGRLLKRISLECIDPCDLARIVESKKHLFEDRKAQEVLMEAFKHLALSMSEPPCSIQPTMRSERRYCVREQTQPPCGEAPVQSCISCNSASTPKCFCECCENDNCAVASAPEPVREPSSRKKSFREIRQKFADKRRQDGSGQSCQNLSENKCQSEETPSTPTPRLPVKSPSTSATATSTLPRHLPQPTIRGASCETKFTDRASEIISDKTGSFLHKSPLKSAPNRLEPRSITAPLGCDSGRRSSSKAFEGSWSEDINQRLKSIKTHYNNYQSSKVDHYRPSGNSASSKFGNFDKCTKFDGDPGHKAQNPLVARGEVRCHDYSPKSRRVTFHPEKKK